MANVSAVTTLNQLTKERDDYKIEVKVHNVWKKFYYSNASVPSSLEMVLIDREGNKIRAGIEKDGIRYFQATFKEGRFLYLSRFSVIDNIDDKIKFITNPYKIMIYKTANVQKAPEFELQNDIFRVVTYDEVNERLLAPDEIFDVTGRVINIIKFRTIKKKNVERISLEFELLNHSGERIRCDLWGEHAIRLLALAKEYQEANTPIIALIHNCKLKNWDGISDKLDFVIYIIDDTEPRKDFKEDVSDLLSKFTDAKPVCVADIVKLPKDASFVVCGTVTRVFDTDGWFQQYCCKCDKKLVDTYNVELEKSCVDPFDIPPEVNGIRDQTFVWLAKIKDFNVKNNYMVYTVVDATDDANVINEIATKLSKKGHSIDLDNDESDFKTPKAFILHI
ncbi:uncharacterized protein [Rutidosis leptorrhynchoides]|uniref:uncharacterized protein n=1 Tax=Rutidosis leptorrhynchoides TaxID=125765 RepID=UPI003A98EF4F